MGTEANEEPYLDEETGMLWVEAGFHNNWQTYKLRCDDDDEALHVVPLGDTGSHLLHEFCHCEPQMNADGVWEHNAYDCREAYEQKKRKPN